MATIQRPVKTYGTRRYSDEVGLAPGNQDPILASEVDGDLDTMYAAWNAGTDTVNLKDGCVSAAKLGTDCNGAWKVSGATITPNDATKAVALAPLTNPLQASSLTTKARLTVGQTIDLVQLAINRSYEGVRDDTSKVAWYLGLRADTDKLEVGRVSAAGSLTIPLTLDATGTTISGTSFLFNGNPQANMVLLGAGTTGSSVYYSRSSRGTIAAPTATQNGDIFGSMQMGGYGTAYSDQVLLRAIAAENWTGTARGASFFIYTTGLGQTSINQNLSFDANGNLAITGSVGQKASGTTWSNPSDRRIKDEIADYTTGLAAILDLQPRTFLYNGKGGSQAGLRGYGYIADEAASVMAEMLSVTKAKLNADDAEDTDIQTLDTSNVTLALVNAVKELAARVTALEAR